MVGVVEMKRKNRFNTEKVNQEKLAVCEGKRMMRPSVLYKI